MPLFRAGSKIIYFAHVPKCAGSSMVKYLRDRFGPLAFHDSEFYVFPEPTRWSKTSPQHVDADVLGRLFPAGFIDASFAVVRHPLPRLISAFHFQLEVEQKLPKGTDFSTWLKEIKNTRIKEPYAFDNHIRPMVDIVPAGAQIFHLEHGTDNVIGWLNGLVGDTAGPRVIERLNERGAHGTKKTQKAQPTADDVKVIQELYAKDFERFGYDPENWKGLSKKTFTPREEKSPKFSIKNLVNGLGGRRA